MKKFLSTGLGRLYLVIALVVSTIIGFIFEMLDFTYLYLFGIEKTGSIDLGEMFIVGISISLIIFLIIADRIIWYLQCKLFS